jgi:hypothetical protein
MSLPTRCLRMISLITLSRSRSISGNKATKARNWSIPVVNHTWLEDCFIQWRNLSVGLEKYVVFPPGLDFSDHLGERGIQREIILETLPDLIAEMTLARGRVNSVEKDSVHRNGENLSQVTVQRPSGRRVQEAEEAMGRPETEHRMGVDARSQSTGVQGVGGDHMQVDGPVPNLEPKRTRRSSRRTAEDSSPLRQPTPSPQRTREGLSSNKRRYRADPETTEEDAPSPTKRSAYAKSAMTSSPVMGPSKSRAITPVQTESVLMPPKGTGEALGKSPRQLTIKTSPVKTKRKGGETRSHSVFVEHRPPMSSLTVDTTMDREEGPSRRTSRRSAASKATQRLRDEVMPDVINFEKELRRGHVRAVSLLKNERGGEKNAAVPKSLAKGKKRASIQFTLEDVVSSGDEHERKKRRLSGTKAGDRFKEHDDDEGTDVTGANSQGSAEIPSSKGWAKGAKVKKPTSGRDSRQVKSIPHDSFSLVDWTQRQTRGDLGYTGHPGRKRRKGLVKSSTRMEPFVHCFCPGQALIKLGARVGVKPDECTHLVVKTIARTEKLLCAMAVAPAIVTENWVRDSIATKKLLRGWFVFVLFHRTRLTCFVYSYR